MRTTLFLDGEWPANYPFHLIDLKLNDQLDKLNLSPLNNSQVSNVVLLHTRGDYCYNYSTCMSVIRGKQINIVSFIGTDTI